MASTHYSLCSSEKEAEQCFVNTRGFELWYARRSLTVHLLACFLELCLVLVALLKHADSLPRRHSRIDNKSLHAVYTCPAEQTARALLMDVILKLRTASYAAAAYKDYYLLVYIARRAVALGLGLCARPFYERIWLSTWWSLGTLLEVVGLACSAFCPPTAFMKHTSLGVFLAPKLGTYCRAWQPLWHKMLHRHFVWVSLVDWGLITCTTLLVLARSELAEVVWDWDTLVSITKSFALLYCIPNVLFRSLEQYARLEYSDSANSIVNNGDPGCKPSVSLVQTPAKSCISEHISQSENNQYPPSASLSPRFDMFVSVRTWLGAVRSIVSRSLATCSIASNQKRSHGIEQLGRAGCPSSGSVTTLNLDQLLEQVNANAQVPATPLSTGIRLYKPASRTFTLGLKVLEPIGYTFEDTSQQLKAVFQDSISAVSTSTLLPPTLNSSQDANVPQVESHTPTLHLATIATVKGCVLLLAKFLQVYDANKDNLKQWSQTFLEHCILKPLVEKFGRNNILSWTFINHGRSDDNHPQLSKGVECLVWPPCVEVCTHNQHLRVVLNCDIDVCSKHMFRVVVTNSHNVVLSDAVLYAKSAECIPNTSEVWFELPANKIMTMASDIVWAFISVEDTLSYDDTSISKHTDPLIACCSTLTNTQSSTKQTQTLRYGVLCCIPILVAESRVQREIVGLTPLPLRAIGRVSYGGDAKGLNDGSVWIRYSQTTSPLFHDMATLLVSSVHPNTRKAILHKLLDFLTINKMPYTTSYLIKALRNQGLEAMLADPSIAPYVETYGGCATHDKVRALPITKAPGSVELNNMSDVWRAVVVGFPCEQMEVAYTNFKNHDALPMDRFTFMFRALVVYVMHLGSLDRGHLREAKVANLIPEAGSALALIVSLLALLLSYANVKMYIRHRECVVIMYGVLRMLLYMPWGAFPALATYPMDQGTPWIRAALHIVLQPIGCMLQLRVWKFLPLKILEAWGESKLLASKYPVLDPMTLYVVLFTWSCCVAVTCDIRARLCFICRSQKASLTQGCKEH